MATTIATRQILYQRFVDATPRFFITSPDTIPSIEDLEAEQPTAAIKAVAGHILKGTAVVTRHHRYWPALIETLSELTRRSTLDSRVPTRLLRQLAGGCCEGAN